MSKTSIETIHFSKSVCGVRYNAFDGLCNLKAFSVDPENRIYETEDGVLYTKGKVLLKHYPADKEGTEFTVPEETKYIEMKAFCESQHLERVFLNLNITEIPRAAFCRCSNLKEVHVPRSVTEIGSFAFSKSPNVIIHCPIGSYAQQYAQKNDIPFIITKEEMRRPLRHWDASVPMVKRGGVLNSAREGLEIFKEDAPSILPPFARINTEPKIYIGKFENGVYYKANVLERPFISTAREAYRILKGAFERHVDVDCPQYEWNVLVKDCKEEARAAKKAKEENER